MSDARGAAERARALVQPAFISVLSDADVRDAVEDAADGPLHGLPLAVKDNIDVAGLPSTAACPALTTPAGRSATAVRRLVDAGAVPIGKTNLDQFATGLVGTRSPFGACSSVFSDAHISGGSSSGSAVAVALGIVPLALGTDTAGSGRVPAAFNGLVGVKPSRGLISVRGVLPACPSLDCVSVFSRSVAQGRAAFEIMLAADPEDPYSRRMPSTAPDGVAEWMRTVGVPSGPLDLDEPHRLAWEQALVATAAAGIRLVPVDITPFLAVARMLYEPAFVAERLAAFGHLLEPDGPHLDPVVRSVVLRGAGASAIDVFDARQRLAVLARAAVAAFVHVDALLLPVTPGHPTHAEVAADPVGINARLGTYTNMVNLLDLCAVAIPAGMRSDGLPFGVQLIAPAFADLPLLDLAARLTGEATRDVALPADRRLLAVCGAHLSGQPLNSQLAALGGRLHRRAHTAGGYRMFRLPGTMPRPGLVDTGDGPGEGLEVELWNLPAHGFSHLRASVVAPLQLGPVRLDDGTTVTGFLAEPSTVTASRDITHSGGWRAYLATV